MIAEEKIEVLRLLEQVESQHARIDAVNYFKQQFNLTDDDVCMFLGITRPTYFSIRKGRSRRVNNLALALLMHLLRGGKLK